MPFLHSASHHTHVQFLFFNTRSGSRRTLRFDLPPQGRGGRLSQVLLSFFQLHPDTSHSCSMHSCLYCHQSPSPLQLKQLYKHNSIFSTTWISMSTSSDLLLRGFCRWNYMAVYRTQCIKACSQKPCYLFTVLFPWLYSRGLFACITTLWHQPDSFNVLLSSTITPYHVCFPTNATQMAYEVERIKQSIHITFACVSHNIHFKNNVHIDKQAQLPCVIHYTSPEESQ